MAENERVLVIGGTRGAGREMVRLLLRDGNLVRVLARDAGRARAKMGETVEVVEGDVTRPETLPEAMRDVDAIILTVGVPRRPMGRSQVRAVEYDGTRNVLKAARQAGFNGRFLYMSALGTTRPSVEGVLLNLLKGGTLHWRRRGERQIRQSGFDYTITHAGILTDAAPGRQPLEISQNEYPLSLRYRISRADVAEVFVQALRHPQTRNTTFDAVWAQDELAETWHVLFARLVQGT